MMIQEVLIEIKPDTDIHELMCLFSLKAAALQGLSRLDEGCDGDSLQRKSSYDLFQVRIHR